MKRNDFFSKTILITTRTSNTWQPGGERAAFAEALNDDSSQLPPITFSSDQLEN